MAQATGERLALEAATADFFAALSSPIRLAALQLLVDGEIRVTDLVAALDIAQPRLSNHHACLPTCGLVTVRRQGSFLFDALAHLVHLGTAMAQPSADGLWRCPALWKE